MRNIELKVKSRFNRFVIACPTHSSYGIGVEVKENSLDTTIVFGEFDVQHVVNVITNLDELPMEFILWYSSIWANMKTVNQKQQESQLEPIAYEEIAPLNGGIFDYSLETVRNL